MKPILTLGCIAVGVLAIGQARGAPSSPSTFQFTCPPSLVDGQEVRMSGLITAIRNSKDGDIHLEVETRGNLAELNLKNAMNVSAGQASRTLSVRFIPKDYNEDAFVNVTLDGGVAQIGTLPARVMAHDWKGSKNDPVRQLIAADCAYTMEAAE